MAYAEDTSVPIERSRAEIEKMLQRHGADQFMSGWGENVARITFRAHGRYVRFELQIPRKDEERFTHYERGRNFKTRYQRSAGEALQKWEQACRSRWRALALVIKAKLEAIDAGIATFESEFLAHVVLPDNTLVGDRVRGAIEQAYETGKMPALMAPGEGEAHET